MVGVRVHVEVGVPGGLVVGAEEEVAYKRSDRGRSRSSERGSVNGMSRSSSRSRVLVRVE